MNSETELKTWLVEKAGESYEKERKRAEGEIGQDIEWDGDVTVDIIIEYMASQFPELVLAMAEENFIRGYRQALLDVEASERNENEQKQA
jgi:hypothetical protein|tara:strand:- start:1566 stop:1835 length:270 start_codon:yes stop_codon:yes gene_type:complete